MKQTNKKYISKEMAMMAALTTESMLLHENHDAMLYWNSITNHYVIMVNYVNDNPAEKYQNYSCSRIKKNTRKDDVIKEVVFYFSY